MKTRQIGLVVLWMTGTLLSFSLLAISIRGLSGRLNLFEILAVRSGVAFALLLLIMMVRRDLWRGIRTQKYGTHFVRSAVHFLAQWGWTYGVMLLPLAMVFALEFTMPAWVAILAALFLGERLTTSRVGVIIFGILGVLVILRPGLADVQPAAFIVLAGAFGFATVMAMTKRLTATETTIGIVFWMNLMQFPMGLIGADSLTFIDKLGVEHIPAAFGIGLANLSAHFCLSNAMRSGDASVVVPLDFLRIPLIAFVGWLLYNESIDIWVFVGAGLIVVGVLWNLRAEAARGRQLPVEPAALGRDAGGAPG